jgi:hypothetical protein
VAELTWQEVFQVHRKIRAAYFEAGKVKSMLFSQDRRRKRINYKKGDTLCFCFFESALEVKQTLSQLHVGDIFKVYEKVAPDTWADIGNHKCVSIGEGKDAANRAALVVEVEPVKKK